MCFTLDYKVHHFGATDEKNRFLNPHALLLPRFFQRQVFVDVQLLLLVFFLRRENGGDGGGGRDNAGAVERDGVVVVVVGLEEDGQVGRRLDAQDPAQQDRRLQQQRSKGILSVTNYIDRLKE